MIGKGVTKGPSRFYRKYFIPGGGSFDGGGGRDGGRDHGSGDGAATAAVPSLPHRLEVAYQKFHRLSRVKQTSTFLTILHRFAMFFTRFRPVWSRLYLRFVWSNLLVPVIKKQHSLKCDFAMHLHNVVHRH